MTQCLSFSRPAPGTPRWGVSVKRIQWGLLDPAWPPELGLTWELRCAFVAMWGGMTSLNKSREPSWVCAAGATAVESDILMIMKVLIKAVNVHSQQQPARVPSGPKDS